MRVLGRAEAADWRAALGYRTTARQSGGTSDIGNAVPRSPVVARMTRIVVATDFGGPEELVVEDVETPQPGAGEVRITVRVDP